MKKAKEHIVIHVLLLILAITGVVLNNVLLISFGLMGVVFFILLNQYRYEIEKTILKKTIGGENIEKGSVYSFFDRRGKNVRSLLLPEKGEEVVDFHLADITKKIKLKKLKKIGSGQEDSALERFHHFSYKYLVSVKTHSIFLLQLALTVPIALILTGNFSFWVLVVIPAIIFFVVITFYEEFFQINRFEVFTGDNLSLDYQEETNRIRVISKLFAENVFGSINEPINEHILISGELVLEQNNEFYLLSIHDQYKIYEMFSEYLKRETKKRQ